MQALKQLGAELHDDTPEPHGNQTDKPSSQTMAFLHGALVRRLMDQEPSVVSTALSLPVLHSLPSTAVYPAVASVLARCAEVAGNPDRKAEHKAWRVVAKQVWHKT